MKYLLHRCSLLLLLSAFSFSLPAQDTLRVMHYNLLHYGGSGPGGCTLTSTSTKNIYLKTIIENTLPDIFTINEMGPSTLYASNILMNVLDLVDPDYERTTFTNYAGSEITNHLFYNSAKLGVAKEQALLHAFRDINYYKLYYKDPGLAAGSDTTFIHCMVVHIDGSGATTPTAISQATMIMSYMDGLGEPGNYLLLGDLNSDASTDDAMDLFYNHANADCRFYDPISKPGTWHNSSAFAAYHTQSTAVSRSDCGASGGMDDRFDHIMISRFIKDDSARVKYIPGSYRGYGNDGAHYNLDINGTPTNTAVSAAVANALYAMSDHLPVILDLEITSLPASVGSFGLLPTFSLTPNPSEGRVRVGLGSSGGRDNSLLEVMDLSGKVQLRKEVGAGLAETELDLTGFAPGIYMVRYTVAGGNSAVKRIVRL